LLNEVVDLLKIQSNQNGVDCTVGGGGHARELLRRSSPRGKLLGIDWDDQACDIAARELSVYKNRVLIAKGTYTDIKEIVKDNNFLNVHYILCDLGLSSYQLEDGSRGFTFSAQGNLDMRFSEASSLTADEILHNWSEKELRRIFIDFGEERLAGHIAK